MSRIFFFFAWKKGWRNIFIKLCPSLLTRPDFKTTEKSVHKKAWFVIKPRVYLLKCLQLVSHDMLLHLPGGISRRRHARCRECGPLGQGCAYHFHNNNNYFTMLVVHYLVYDGRSCVYIVDGSKTTMRKEHGIKSPCIF